MFQLETGMFFFSTDINTARNDYKRLVKLGIETDVPCKAKVQLARYSDDKFAVSLIYPAEYDDEISGWLLEHKFQTAGIAEGGISAVTRYYDAKARNTGNSPVVGSVLRRKPYRRGASGLDKNSCAKIITF